MPVISGLGHVGLYCFDLEVQARFYTEVLGLTKTDEIRERGLVFLSAQPDVEHHELLLVAGPQGRARRSGRPADLVPMCFARRRDRLLPALSDRGVNVDMVASHGNAIGVYFYDPEGNRGEVYCSTGLVARQPFLEPVEPRRRPRNDPSGDRPFGRTATAGRG